MALSVAISFALLAAAGINIGKIFQKEAANKLPQLVFQRAVLYQYVTSKDWLLGIVCDVGGTVWMVLALSLAPVSVVEPISGSGLAFLAVFSHYYLQEKLSRKQWIGVGFAVCGVIGMGLTATPPSDNTMSSHAALSMLALLAALQAALEVCFRKYKRSEAIEVVSGLQAGMLFGLSCTATRVGQVLAQQTGELFFAGGGIACSVMLSPVGLFFQTRGFKQSRAVVVITFTVAASLLTGVLVGLIVLNEPIPQDSTTFALWSASISSILISLLLLMERGASNDSDKKVDKAGELSSPKSLCVV